MYIGFSFFLTIYIALTVSDIDSYVGLIHTLFALEDLYGFKISSIDGKLCLTLDK
jgi:hypothetical protein